MEKYVGNANFYIEEKKDIMISKSNTLIEAGFELTLAEHDLMTLAINKLHKQDTGNHEVFITAKEFSIATGISESHAYQALKSTANDLMNRQLKFPLYIDLDKKNNNESNTVNVLPPKHTRFETVKANYNWLQGIAYADNLGFVYIHFSDPLRFLIDKTGEAYTNYNFSSTIDMKSFNSKRLYELVCKWKKLGATKSMFIDEWKEFFGVADKYPNVAEFKRRVLDPSIKAINEQGEFELTLKQEKIGRIISHFQIVIKEKDKRKNLLQKINNVNKTDEPLDMFKQPEGHKLSPQDSSKYASKLCQNGTFGSKFAHSGESEKEFLFRITVELQKIEKVKKYESYLRNAGYRFPNDYI